MCLLVTQSADVVFDRAFLEGVYKLNPDGIGVMYSENNTLFINKHVPVTEEAFIEFFEKNIQGRDCAWHARMRTHGDIDITNCHPYQVLSSEDGYPIYMAHNGVLSTGNARDKTKSDTWHYIQNYLRPLLLQNPKLFMEPAFIEMLGAHIGSGNKFVLMDAYGNRVTINERQGVEHNDAWLSNTYAWDTTGSKYDYKKAYASGSSYGYNSKSYQGWNSKKYSDPHGYAGLYGDTDDYEDEASPFPALTHSQAASPNEAALASVSPSDEEDMEFQEALDFCYELFEMMGSLKMNSDGITWDHAEDYYHAVGYNQAFAVIEALWHGAYTEAEIRNEILYYSQEEEEEESVAEAPSQGVLSTERAAA